LDLAWREVFVTPDQNPGVGGRVDIGRLKRTVVVRGSLLIVMLGLMYFGAAGTFRYWQAWAYLGTLLIPMFFVVAYLFRRDPELLERRMRTKEREREQKLITKIVSIFFLAALILPGLDRRFGWSFVPPAVVIAADFIVLAGYGLIALVFKENSYASRIVEIDASQKVISTGPYRWVRHPMYLGVIMLYVFSPLALGSAWAVLPVLALPPLLAARILNEEKVLSAGLDGYRDYMRRVRCRLIPGIW
jgi:protein-S-isoprenylcysteine O-methyltransferase Ste14